MSERENERGINKETYNVMALRVKPTHWVAALSVAIKMHVKIKNFFPYKKVIKLRFI